MSRRVLFIAASGHVLGGVPDWLDYLLPGLEDRGWECWLGLGAGRFHDVDRYLQRHPWHRVERVINPTGSREGRVHAIAALIERVRPDLVAAVNIVDVYEAVRRMRIRGATAPRAVMTLHGLDAGLFDDLRIERDVMDAVVVTNQLARKIAGESIAAADRVLYAAYGVPMNAGSAGQAAREDGHGSPPGRLKLLYCGRIEQNQKRVLDLTLLMLELRRRGIDARISIAGGGPSEAALRARIAELELQDAFDFLGVLMPEQLAMQYLGHDALLITSTWETGPIVAWEAMSHGLPVLSSRYVGSGLEAALVDGENSLLFPIGDMSAAAEAVARLRDPELRRCLVQAGRELVVARYSRESSVRQWSEAFERVLAMPPLAMPTPRRSEVAGRIDKVFGARLGEQLRRLLGVAYPHRSAGGEWPHITHSRHENDLWLADIAKWDVRT